MNHTKYWNYLYMSFLDCIVCTYIVHRISETLRHTGHNIFGIYTYLLIFATSVGYIWSKMWISYTTQWYESIASGYVAVALHHSSKRLYKHHNLCAWIYDSSHNEPIYISPHYSSNDGSWQRRLAQAWSSKDGNVDYLEVGSPTGPTIIVATKRQHGDFRVDSVHSLQFTWVYRLY